MNEEYDSNEAAKQTAKKKILKWLVGLIAPAIPFILIGVAIMVVILGIFGPVAMAKDSSETSDDAGFFEKFGNFLSGNGWTSDEQAFFTILRENNLSCKQSTLVTATILYYYQSEPSAEMNYGEVPTDEPAENTGDTTTDTATDNSVEVTDTTTQETDEMYSDIPYGQLLPDLKRLVKMIVKGNNAYEEYVKGTFLKQSPYNKLLEGADDEQARIDEIYENIKSVSDTLECDTDFGYYNINCPGVVVTGNHAGTYSLEEYIAGVVKAENGGAPTENLKAQAVMARTYLLKLTNNCTTSIENSERNQVFIPTEEEIYVNAATETAGQVLVLNGNLISTYFASYPQAGYNGFPSFPACSSVICDSTTCSTTFYKMPNAESFTLTTNILNPDGNYWNGSHLQNQSGHCYGYSQVAGRDLELNQGMDYTEILVTFHSDGVQISSLGTGPGSLAADSTGFTRRVGRPDETNESDKNFWFSSNNLSYSSGYVGECTWYAFGRANEILSLAGSSYRWKYAPHAGKWYEANLNDGENGFKSSIDINSPKAGSILVLKKGNSYGHVAIVEGVYEDGDIAISEGNIGSVRTTDNPYGFRYIDKINPEVYVSTLGSGYSFAGYIYLLE